MYELLIPNIQATLEAIPAIREVYPYRLPGNPKKYPAVIFTQQDNDNAFLTTADNFKVVRFKVWVVVNLSGTNEKEVFTDILPKTVDKVIEAFDANWNRGTLDGHRIWAVFSTNEWGLAQEQKSKEAFCELTLTIKLATTN